MSYDKIMNMVIVRSLHEHGVIIDKIDETKDIPIFYISVPEFSYRKNVDGNDVANKYLASKFKETITMKGGKCEVKMKVRKNEYWTESMANTAISEFDKMYRYRN